MPFRAIEHGNAYALGHFEVDGEDIQGTRLFDTMRYKAVLALKAKGYTLHDLPMNGLHIVHKGYDVKILKSQRDGKPPIAGKSKQRWKFYNHGFGQGRFPDEIQKVIDELGLEERRELIVLYKVGHDGGFIGLDLACIESADHQYGTPLLAWGIPVPHPATASNSSNNYLEGPIDLGNIDTPDESDDLDIFKDGTNE